MKPDLVSAHVHRGGKWGDERGFALFTVTIFAFLVTLIGAAYFAMAAYETHQAVYRENSSEAFYLADAGIERARGEFAVDLSWTGPVSGASGGHGTYDVTVTPSTWNGNSQYQGMDVVKVHSTGHVRGADRAVDTWATVPSILQSKLMIVMHDIDANGNICLQGDAHANNDADFGPNDVHLKCGGTYTDGFPLNPPKIYTEPARYPNSTYYQVYVSPFLSSPGGKAYCWIYKNGVNVTGSMGDSLSSVLSFKSGRYQFDFGPPEIKTWFTNTGAPAAFFRADTLAGQHSVVVNFAEPVTPYPAKLVNLHFQQNPGDPSIHATIINTRFTGASDDQRLDTKYWSGGVVDFKTAATFEPDNGLTLVCHDFDQGNAQVTLGTPAYPGLVYVTHDAYGINGDLSLTGAVIVLHDWSSTGGPTLTYDESFLARLPPELQITKQSGTTGIMTVLEWREVAAN